MRPLRILFLLGVLWLGIELVTIPVAGRLLEQQVATRSGGANAVDANIGNFPVLTRFALTGRVEEATVVLERVTRLGLTFTEVRFELDGVTVDRGALARRRVEIDSIDRGSVTATIDLTALSPRIPAALRNVRVAGRSLIAGPISVRLSSELLPCDPQVRVLGDQAIATCSFTSVPRVLLG